MRRVARGLFVAPSREDVESGDFEMGDALVSSASRQINIFSGRRSCLKRNGSASLIPKTAPTPRR